METLFILINISCPSLPRCYTDQTRLATKSSPSSPYSRSVSVETNQKHNYKLQPRPKLKRETAQDVEDADILTDEDRPRSGAVNEITQKW